MEQRRTLFKETRPGNPYVTAERGSGYAQKKILDWLVTIRRLVIKGDFLEIEIFEEPAQALLLDAAGKCAAAHDPIINSGRRSLHPAEKNGYLTERAIFVFVADAHQECRWVAKIGAPCGLIQALSVKVELICLVNELEGPMVVLFLAESDHDGGMSVLKKTIQRSSFAICRVTQSGRCPDAIQTDGIFVRNDRFSEEVAQTPQELPKSLPIGLWENQTFDLGESSFDFGEFHRTVVDENYSVGSDVPCFQDAANGLRFRAPINVNRIQGSLADQQVFSLEGLFNEGRVILAGHCEQRVRHLLEKRETADKARECGLFAQDATKVRRPRSRPGFLPTRYHPDR